MLSLGHEQIGVPVIAEPIFGIALNGGLILLVGSTPVPIEVKKDIRQGSVSLGRIGIELDGFQRSPARSRHNFRWTHYFVKGLERQAVRQSRVGQGEPRIFLNRRFERSDGLL